MQKLGAVDANFLYSESDRMPNHIASVQRFALPDGVTPSNWVESLRGYVRNRSHLVDYLHRRLQFVPANFDHPVWVEAEEIDMTHHIREVPLEAPGTLAQLEQKIAEIHAGRMDRSRPLWDMHVVTGLEDGTVAVYNRIHHAAIDGLAGQVATMLIMDTTPDHPAIEPVKADPDEAGLSSQFQSSIENLFRYQIGAGSRMLAQVNTMRRLMQRAADPSKSFGALLQTAPRTRFNAEIDVERSFAVGELSFQDVRAMGKQLGATVNDVFMTICAGGLRRYLKRRGELPGASLIAGCPVSLRQPGDNKMGNHVTMMKVALGTDIEDPRVRLLAVRESSNIAKQVTADLAEAYDGEISLPGLPAMATALSAAAERTNWTNMVQMHVNVVISNVPGPREQLYMNGASMLTHYPVSIPAHGVGLNITVQSYGSQLYFGVTACGRALPDPEVLRDDMIAAFVELFQAVMPSNVSELKTRVRAQPARQEQAAASEAAESQESRVA